MELFNIFVSISIDSSDFDDGVKDARKSADKLADELGDNLPKSTKKAADGIEDATKATEEMSNGFTVTMALGIHAP